ncbi:hypothetical protein NRY66_13675, partial [Acidithiobacillus ferrooxidans]|nr:hypothetical protein [Acidithiobacillus ferrooxidans]
MAADLGLALARYAIVDDLTRSLSVMGKVVHEELRMAWELGHQSASADVIPEVDLSTLLSQHDTVWAQGQADQYAARDHWGQYAHSLWSAWESFTREAWQVSLDVPFRAWLPICRVDDELLQPIKTLKNIAPET